MPGRLDRLRRGDRLGRRLVEAAPRSRTGPRSGAGRPPRRSCPTIRTTIGTSRSWTARASIRPRATSSPRVIPPKMLTRIARTFGSARIRRIAAATLSARAPPPMSRKLAGSPPARLTRSIVVIARPAPLTMQPIEPSRWMKAMPWRARLGVGRVLRVRVAQGLELGMAGEGRVVEGDLGVEADQSLDRHRRSVGSRTIASGLTSTRSASLASIVATRPRAIADEVAQVRTAEPDREGQLAGLPVEQPEVGMGRRPGGSPPASTRATSSISTPPSAEAMTTIRRRARSRIAPR